MSGIRIDRRLELLRDGLVGYMLRNNSGSTVGAGSPVIFDTSVQAGDAFTTTTAADNALVAGMLTTTLANQEVGFVAMMGHTDILKVDGTTDIATGDHISTFTTAAVGAKATAGKAGKFAIALEAYTTNDSLGVIDAFLMPAARGDNSALSSQLNNDIDLVFGTTDAAATAARIEYDTAETNDGVKIGLPTANRRLIIEDYGDMGTDTTLAAATNPTLTIVDAAATDYLHLSTTTTQGQIDVNSGNTLGFSVAATDVARFNASELELVSATNLQFLGNDKIVDSNANELIDFVAVGSATNGLKVTNATTGNPVRVGADGTGATANRGMRLDDSNANEMLELKSSGSATNHLLITNQATGTAVELSAAGTGSDANTGIVLMGAGTGPIIINNGTDPVDLRFMGASGSFTNRVSDLSGNELIEFWATASAVNEFGITNVATGNPPIFEVKGGDAAIDMLLYQKGTGVLRINNDTDPVGIRFYGAAAALNKNLILDVNANELLELYATASAVNHLTIVNSATTVNAKIDATSTGADTNVGITLAPKGTGGVNIAPATTGSAATPSIYYDGDVDTGHYVAAANVLSISTGGTARGFWKISGLGLQATNVSHSTAGTNALICAQGTAPSGAATTASSIYASGTIMRKIIADGTDSAVG